MANNVTVVYNSTYDMYQLRINGNHAGYYEQSVANQIKERLQKIFNDSNRDLDFITPSHNGSQYVVSCPKVRKNVGEKTYFYDTTTNASNNYYPAKLYEPTNWSDSSIASEQTAIYAISNSNSAPWYDALVVANLIRGALSLNFKDAAGNSTCQKLTVPTNTKSSVASVISSSARCDFYGVPCQGTQPGTQSSCPEIGYAAENILSAKTAIGEVFHPQDLTAAITSTNNWYSSYRGKYVRVTNLSNTSKQIVVKITDLAPANKGIELSYRAWQVIGKPSGENTVKIELMS